jgi:hypothetical protein
MAEWKKVLVSGSQASVAGISGSELTDGKLLFGKGTQGAITSATDVDLNSSGHLEATFSGSFSGSFFGDASGLTNIPGTTLDIDAFPEYTNSTLNQTQDEFVFSDNGTEKRINFSRLEDSIFANISGDATVAAGGGLTIANDAVETSMLAHSLGDLAVHQFTGSFSGSFDGKVNIVDTNTAASFQLVFREGTATGYSTLYADDDNAKLRYNPGTNTLENTTLIGNVTGDLTGTADSASYAGSVNYGDIIGTPTLDNYVQWHMAGDADTQAIGSNEWVHFVGGASITGAGTEVDPYLMEITPATASYVLNAVSASHVASAYDTVSVSNATISLTDMGGNTDQITVNNVVNADTASAVTVTADNSTDLNFYITTAKNVGGQSVYAHSGLAFNPSTSVVSANTGDLHFNATSFTGSFKGDLAGTADIASAVDVTAATANADYRITMVDNTGTSGETLYVDSGLTYNPSTDSLTVSGDLFVNGTTTNINTDNLDVEDAFILLRSGSATRGDTGIIFGGANAVAQSGTAMIWDASYNSNDGRLAIVNTLASDATGNQTPDYYVAGVFEGTEAAAATAQADHNGNIRIESGDIFIYA